MKSILATLIRHMLLPLALLSVVIPFARAQDTTPERQESVQIIVTTDTITIGTNFTGTVLYIAGVVQNADPLVSRQSRYNVILTLESPSRKVVMREKKRRLGMWVNADAITFDSVPLYYSLAGTRELRDITSPQVYRDLGIGMQNLPLRADSKDNEKITAFRNQLVRLGTAEKLYSENPGAVMLDTTSLFRAQFQLPANIPVGNYKVNAYLFRDGIYLSHASTQMDIVKAHLAYSIYRAAYRHGLWYGLTAVAIAILTGFAGRFFFRRD